MWNIICSLSALAFKLLFMVSVAQAIVDFLDLQGTKYIFGNVASHTTPIVEHVSRGQRLKFISSYHEQAAILMADGYARAHGAFAVALLSGTNAWFQALPAFTHAAFDGSPVVLITAEDQMEYRSSRRHLVRTYSEDVGFNQENWSPAIVSSPHTTIQTLSKALRRVMVGRKEPVHVRIPYNFLSQETAEDPSQHTRRESSDPAALDSGLIRQAAEMLAEAANPMILLGGGAIWSAASAEAMELADFFFAPIATSNGKSGMVPDDYPLSVGRLVKPNEVALQTLAEADVILVLGCRLGGDALGDLSGGLLKSDVKLIQVDIDPHQIAPSQLVQLGIVGDIKLVLRDILACLKERGAEKWPTRGIQRIQEISERKAIWQRQWNRMSRSTESPIQRVRLLKHIFDEVGPEGVFFGATDWTHGVVTSHFPLVESFQFPIPGANLPLALGAQLALPERQVVALLEGDQAMTVLGEIATAVKHQIPALVVIPRDGPSASGETQLPNGGGIRVDYSLPNFAEIAQSMGAYSETVENPIHIRPAVRRALTSQRPSVLEVVVKSPVEDLQVYLSITGIS